MKPNCEILVQLHVLDRMLGFEAHKDYFYASMFIGRTFIQGGFYVSLSHRHFEHNWTKI